MGDCGSFDTLGDIVASIKLGQDQYLNIYHFKPIECIECDEECLKINDLNFDLEDGPESENILELQTGPLDLTELMKAAGLRVTGFLKVGKDICPKCGSRLNKKTKSCQECLK